MLLEVQDVCCSIQGKNIVSNVSFSVFEGERWAIVGKNGAGKSTLIKCIAGLHQPSSGEIRLQEKPLFAYDPKQRAKNIAYVPQLLEILLPFTVYDYVLMARFSYFGFMAKASAEDRQIVEESIELTDLSDLRRRNLNTLSGGELQRVQIAGAVAQRTKILLLDEPTTFLDPSQQYRIRKVLDKIHSTLNIATITITHDVSSMVRHYSHVLALKNGSMIFSGACSAIKSTYSEFLQSVFDVEFEQYCSEQGILMLVPKLET